MQIAQTFGQFQFRPAKTEDAASIIGLYHVVYNGSYPDPTFTNLTDLVAAINSKDKLVIVATVEEQVVASLLFLYDEDSRLGKAAGAVVNSDYRGSNLTQKMINYCIDSFERVGLEIEMVYATTRTVNRAAQKLTESMGFKKLGIFPNVHKTREYETHALAAMYRNGGLAKRYTTFKQHPMIHYFYKLAASECHLPSMEKEETIVEKIYDGEVGELEVIEAKEFIKYQFNEESKTNCIDFAFFPFAVPNALITNPDRSIEVFANINEVDKHCVIIGCKIDRVVNFSKLLKKVSWILRDRGVRYIEMIAKAHRTNIIDKIIKAKFIPSGYIPALQGNDLIRYDYVIFSRSFEIFDFEHVELEGVNAEYLREYIRLWEESYLGQSYRPLSTGPIQ